MAKEVVKPNHLATSLLRVQFTAAAFTRKTFLVLVFLFLRIVDILIYT